MTITKDIEDWVNEEVERLFEEESRVLGSERRNPVTGYSYSPELADIFPEVDSVEAQKELARAALLARALVPLPSDAPPLPVSKEEFKALEDSKDPFLYLVGRFGQSLFLNKFDFQNFPKFHDYACGATASEFAFGPIKNSQYLRERFPPCPLVGLGLDLDWYPVAPENSDDLLCPKT
jgi:hypothetical protein